MAGIGLSFEDNWLEEQSRGAPEALRVRVMSYVQGEGGALPERLGRAARAALDAVLAHPGDRSVALDLLAADALVTLALKAQAARDPGELARFAGELLGD
jgi:hypothetical protein